MSPLRILYLGRQNPGETALHRRQALERLGHHVEAFSPYLALPRGRLAAHILFKTGFSLHRRGVERYVRSLLANQREQFDVIWVDNGEAISRRLLRFLRHHGRHLINYNCDDPTGARDGSRWRTFLQAIPEYDLCAVVRHQNELEYPRFSARRVLRVWMTADEVAHEPREITPEIQARWGSEVAFVGTWMPERGPFILRLLEAGIPVAIWGNHWNKDQAWPRLQRAWRGPNLVDNDYAYAIQCAKISLGLLSKGNRDLHTTRSSEIPALGGVLCGQRTSEHLTLYADGVEASFWDSGDECAVCCQRLLGEGKARAMISAAGRQRVLANRTYNEPMVSQVLAAVNHDELR